MRTICLITFLFVYLKTEAQDSLQQSKLTVSGYLETYYVYDFSKPHNHTRPSFFYSYNRHNEVNLNIGLAKLSYLDERVRGNFALMAGTYAQYNLANEPGALKYIFEANAGIKLSKKNNLWLDAGIFPSHIGFESAIGKDCWNLTRSILADNSPYYEAGLKLGYSSPNDKIYLSVLALNGWQRIQRIPANQTPAFGTQVTFKPKETITLNWSTYIGNEFPDSLMQWRFFNNVYTQFKLTKQLGIICGLDIGQQQRKKNSNAYDTWYAPVMIIQYAVTEKLKIASRVEHYNDAKQVIIFTGTKNGFQTTGYSLNIDYNVYTNVLFRIEGRALNSLDKIFILNNNLSPQNYFIASSLSFAF